VPLFPGNDLIVIGPVPHEIMHRFGNNVLVGQGVSGEPLAVDYGTEETLGHWGFSSINGVLGGFGAKAQKSEGAVNYSVMSFEIVNNKTFYSDSELYLAGLVPTGAVDDLVIFKNVDYDSIEGRNGRRYFSAGV